MANPTLLSGRIASFPDAHESPILEASDKDQRRKRWILYAGRRRGAWANEAELEAATDASLCVGEDMKDRLRWIRSYAVTEEDGRVGSVCIYEAADSDAIREHGRRIGAPSEDFQMVRGTAAA